MTEANLTLLILLGLPLLLFILAWFFFETLRTTAVKKFGVSEDHDTTVTFGALFGVTLLWIALSGAYLLAAEYPSDRYSEAFCLMRNLVTVLLGGVLGGILAMLISPFGQTDEKRFSSVTKVLSAFVTGFVASKLDALFELAVQKEWPLDPYLFTLAGLTLIATMGAFLMTFVTRIYGPGKQTESKISRRWIGRLRARP